MTDQQVNNLKDNDIIYPILEKWEIKEVSDNKMRDGRFVKGVKIGNYWIPRQMLLELFKIKY